MTDHDHSNTLSVLTLPELMTLHGLLVRYIAEYDSEDDDKEYAVMVLQHVKENLAESCYYSD